jgi:hypothetical protein
VTLHPPPILQLLQDMTTKKWADYDDVPEDAPFEPDHYQY